MTLSRRLYSVVVYLLVPLVMVRLFLRGLRTPAYRLRLGERFGFGVSLPRSLPVLWVHAVSLGEAQAAVPLVRALRTRYPQVLIAFTTTTPTGAGCVEGAFGADPLVMHQYVPYDLLGAVRRFLDRIHPQWGVVMETELWPNLMHACHKRGMPLLLANARLSERSARGYGRFSALTQETLQCLDAIAAQTEADAERFRKLGTPQERVRVTGNLKFDLQLPASLWEEAAALRRDWCPNRPVWIAASTHEGEEEAVIAAHAALRKTIPNALLLIAPRHPERFSRVAALCRRMGFPAVAWSEHTQVPESCAIYLGDTMGRLPLFYAASDAAFVGGSLVPIGGHNPLEPAALGIPVAFGPHCFHFVEITQLLLEAEAAQTVQDRSALTDTMIRWLQDAHLRDTVGHRGRRVVESHRGALHTLLEMLDRNMRDVSPP